MQPRQNKILLYRHDEPNGAMNQPRKVAPFICTPRVPICPSFNSIRGHPSLISVHTSYFPPGICTLFPLFSVWFHTLYFLYDFSLIVYVNKVCLKHWKCLYAFFGMVSLERLERGGPCWLLKLRWMGTHRVQMKGVLLWLVCWVCRPSTNFFFLTVHYCISIHFPYRPASGAGSRAGSPVS